MQKVTGIFIGICTIFVLLSFNVPRNEKIQWLTIEELQKEYQKKPKPILIDIYTKWCGWCKVMDKETYTNDLVANYITENYYAVKFDAESKDSVEWNGKKYGYNPAARSNELAIYLLSGRMSYPTTIFIPELTGRPASLAGYLKPNQIESVLKYFNKNTYKSIDYTEFMKTFKSSW
mgnify:FL=1